MRFAAKEAIVKAMGTGFAHGIWIRDVGVVQNAWGRPEVVYSPRGEKVRRKLGIGDGHVTLTDEAGLIVAVAVLETGSGRKRRRGAGNANRARGSGAMNTLVFDIETVPDVEFGRRLFGLEGLSDDEVGKAMQARARQESGSDFLPHEQHRIVAISCAFRSRDGFRVWSLGEEDAPRARAGAALLRRHREIHARPRELERRRLRPAGAALPRAAAPGAGAALLGNRRRRQGLPLQQLPRPLPLAAHRRHGRAVGLPGPRARLACPTPRCCSASRASSGFDGSQVWDAYQRGELTRIRRYCETDVINTWLIYLRFQHMRGRLTDAGLAEELARTRAWLAEARQPHFDEFLARLGRR